jgi:hypothetical protein
LSTVVVSLISLLLFVVNYSYTIKDRRALGNSSATGYGEGMEGVPARGDIWDRLEAGVLAFLIVLGCQALWLVVPVGTLWLLTRFLGSAAGILIIGLVAMPLALGGTAWMLAAANRRYLRLPGARRDWRRGPLEAVLPASIMLGILAAVIWFVLFANHMPTGREQLIP